MIRWLVIGVIACGGTRVEPERSPPPPPPSASDPVIPKQGPFTLPATWTACSADAECTIVALGCCHETPVNRSSVDKTRRALEQSGREYCAAKSACGPSKNGTWDGEPGACRGGMCAMPSKP